MYTVCKMLEVESGHMLSHHPETCRFPHGHSRRIEFTLSAPELDANGMVIDFKLVKRLTGDFVDRFDHSMCMNRADPMFETFVKAYGDQVIPFDIDPTTEVMAKTIYDYTKNAMEHLKANPESSPCPQYQMQPGVRLVKVRVWETSSSWAEYGEEA